MSLTWEVHCAACHAQFQIYDDEAHELMLADERPLCTKCLEAIDEAHTRRSP